MAIDPTQIDPELLRRVERLAIERSCTVDKLLQLALDSIEIPASSPGRLLGLFADDPALVDDLMQDVYASRVRGALRTNEP